MSADGVLYLGDAAFDIGVYVAAILKSAVASGIESAVFQRYAVYIAQWLFAADVATHQLNVLRMPCQVSSES